jgi:hypothetical protein
MNNSSAKTHKRYISHHGPKAWVVMSYASGNWWEASKHSTRASARGAIKRQEELEKQEEE